MEIVQEGDCLVNGETCTQRGKKIRPGDEVTVGDYVIEVSHGH